jgi:hypothetical protein
LCPARQEYLDRHFHPAICSAFVLFSTKEPVIDWDRAIARNTAALDAIVAALFVLLGLSSGAARAVISRALHRNALRVLRPAESALRRLIVIAALGLVAKPVARRPAPQAPIPPAQGQGRMAFRLFDPREQFDRRPRADFGPKLEPRIHVFGAVTGPLVPLLQPPAQGPVQPLEARTHVSALPLRRRLAAFQAALADVPRQAQRLARWQAKRGQINRPAFTTPLRPGRPPGYRRTPTHVVDHVLAECHGLAYDALQPDTS